MIVKLLRRFGFMGVAALMLNLFALAAPVDAQEFRGLITGQVTDPSGAIVPHVQITAVREGSRQTYSARTNTSGDYSMPYVLPGSYDVTAEATGFKKAVRQGVTLDVSQKITLNFKLEIGTVSEEVTVQADTVVLNTGDASGGYVMDAEKVQNLPLNGRQVYMLLDTLPGVQFTQTTFGAGGFSGTRGWDVNNAYTINGIVRPYNQFTLNGAPITIQTGSFTGTWQVAPNVDAIQQFKVMTNTYDARYGRVGGGTVNVVLKSGGNQIHGTAFDFFRNSVFDANTFTNNARGYNAKGQPIAPRPFHNQHQFGGTVGGRIRSDKTFYFFSFEGWREVIPQLLNPTSTPPAHIRPRADGSVDFSQSGFTIYDPLSTHCANNSNPCTSFVREPFPNNVIPANRISPIGRQILELFPLPNFGTGDTNNFLNSPNLSRYRYNQPIVRIDHNLSSNTRMYGMFTYWRGFEFRNTQGFDGPAMTGNINNERWNANVLFDVTHTFNPRLVGDFRGSWGVYSNPAPNGAVAAGLFKLSAADLGLTMPKLPTTDRDWAPSISVAGYPRIIGNELTPNRHGTLDISPTLTQIKGRHTINYGGQFMRISAVPPPGLGSANGNFSFNRGFTQRVPGATPQNDGHAVASLLLGYPSGGGIDFNAKIHETIKYFGFFVQDDFKLRHNITINLGLRWDTELSPKEDHDQLNAGFCFECVNPISSRITFPGVLPNGVRMVNPLMGGLLFVGKDRDRAYNNYYDQFQPKFGIAWAITPKLVFRGGYGLSFVQGIELGGSNSFSQTTPYISSLDNNLTPTNSFRGGTPFANGLIPPAGAETGLLASVGGGNFYDQYTRRIPYVHQYSAGFQVALPGQMMLDVAYVGNQTRRLRASRQFNFLPPELVAKCAGIATNNCPTLSARVPNPFFNVLPRNTSLGASSTIDLAQLSRPFPHFTDVFSFTEPNGFANYNALQVRVNKRLSRSGAAIRGLSFQASFTYSKAMRADNYLNNGTTIADPIDQLNYVVADNDRPWLFALSGLWNLPVGKGGLVGKEASGILGGLINNWSFDWIFKHQAGTAVGVPGWIFDCPGHPTEVPDHKSSAQWIYNQDPTCFRSLPPNTPRINITRLSYLRNPWEPNLDVSLQKQWALPGLEGKSLQFRAEAFNVTNTPRFPGPSTGGVGATGIDVANRPTKDPITGQWRGFGTISLNQQNFPRQLQFSLKVLF